MAEGDVVVVTGGAGFLGQHIIRLLQEKTSVSEIRAFDIRKYHNELGHKERIPVKPALGDLRKPSDVETSLAGADVVFHVASVVDIASFPDYKFLEEINVDGTANVIRACVKQNVSRLIYTSTIDVAIDRSWRAYDDAVETEPYPRTHLYGGYGGTKCRAEQLVLAANDTQLGKGTGRLRTVSLRPTTMYGEGDVAYITQLQKTTKACFGTFVEMTGVGVHSISYGGNVAWGHIVTSQTLKTNPKVGGQVYTITDDTPNETFAKFAEPFFDVRGYCLAKWRMPFWIAYFGLCLLQLVCFLLRPMWAIGPQVFSRSTLMHVGRRLTFSGRKARDVLGYSPIYTYQESFKRSMSFYERVPL